MVDKENRPLTYRFSLFPTGLKQGEYDLMIMYTPDISGMLGGLYDLYYFSVEFDLIMYANLSHQRFDILKCERNYVAIPGISITLLELQ